MVEPWLRGTLTEVDAVPLADAEVEARPLGLPSVGFQMRHIARSLDRLLTYAEGQQLSARQLAGLKEEMDGGAGLLGARREATFMEFAKAMEVTVDRVMRISPGSYEEARRVGRDRLPTTVGGLLVHCADHTQRHVGQAVTTAKVVVALRG
jgi:hypothetical protein